MSAMGPRRVTWSDTPSVKTFVSQHQYESCTQHLMTTPIETSFVNSSVFRAAAFILGDEMDTMLLLIMATNYLREMLGRYPSSEELFNLLAEQDITRDAIVQAFVDKVVCSESL